MTASLSADEGETPLYIWKDDKSVVALVIYNSSDMDGYIGRYVTYIKAEPVRSFLLSMKNCSTRTAGSLG